ncbi:MAG: TIGR03663 family protein, partial [Acidobacteria bacterium]
MADCMAVVGHRASSGGKDGVPDSERSAPRLLSALGFAAIVLLAAALRLPALDHRPMHADESVHAAKFGRLLEQGAYRYDPTEYHGPTLYYLTLVPARLRGIARYADLDEVVLRSVPATFGVLLVAAHLLLVPVIGYRPAALSALLTAVSPAMVYYSRYFIQETLLVAFSFAALASICRYLRSPRLGWALAAGASTGLMFATKETWVIAVWSMAVALVPAWVVGRGRAGGVATASWRRAASHMAAGILAAAVVSALFFSSFFSHPRGILDALVAYTTYLDRATGGGSSWHLHPWYYYLGLLLFSASRGAPIWTEAAILGLAAVGLFAAFARGKSPESRRPVLVFLAGYAVLMTAIYAAIPYKTP